MVPAERGPGPARLALAASTVTVVILVLALVAAGRLIQSISVFGSQGLAAYRDRIDHLSVPDIVAMKSAHALQAPPYAVGLFGNSRSVEISGSDIGLPNGVYFNFSVGGTTFSQSVATLEYLSYQGKAPKLSIISIDNHDIEFTGAVYWLPPLLFAHRLMNPMPYHEMSGQPASLARYWSLSVTDAVNGMRGQLQDLFKFLRIQQMLRFATDVAVDAERPRDRYRADGSRSRGISADNTNLTIFPGALSDRYARRIEQDLGRLAKLQAGGMRIVIYESPIHPALRQQIEARRTDAVRKFRDNFLAACRSNGLTCLPAPEFTGSLPWADCCHAPPALLGRFIKALL